MKKPASLRNIRQWVANLLVLAMLLGFFEADVPNHEVVASNSQSEFADLHFANEIMQAGSVQVDFFKGNKAEALRSQFGKHLFSFDFDVEDGFRIIYMFYAFVGYLFYWTLRHKLQQ